MNKSKKELYAVFTSLEIKVFSHDFLSRSLINASSVNVHLYMTRTPF